MTSIQTQAAEEETGGYGLALPRFLFMIRRVASAISLSLADLVIRGSAISFLMSRSIALPDSFSVLFFATSP